MEKKTETLKWDGSHLGTWHPQDIEITKNGKATVWLNKTLNIKMIAINSKSCYPCIVDELKPLFGLVKIGTHMVCFKGKSYLLQPFIAEKELTVKELGTVPPYLRAQIQDIYAFRFLMGVSQSDDRHISIRTTVHGQKYALSCCEATEGKGTKALSQTVTNKWFKNSDLNKILTCMLQCPADSTPTSIIEKYRSKIGEVILRINKDFVLLEDSIIRRIYDVICK